MLEMNLALIRTHRNNIRRYRGLLKTKLSDLEREFIEKRMADEQTALDALVAETFPLTFNFPKEPPSSASEWRRDRRSASLKGSPRDVSGDAHRAPME